MERGRENEEERGRVVRKKFSFADESEVEENRENRERDWDEYSF